MSRYRVHLRRIYVDTFIVDADNIDSIDADSTSNLDPEEIRCVERQIVMVEKV